MAAGLQLDWVSVPVVKELPGFWVTEVKLAPEPTAIASAASRLARGTRTLRRVVVELVMCVIPVWLILWEKRYADPANAMATSDPHQLHNPVTVDLVIGASARAVG